jgi:hypothetical protein
MEITKKIQFEYLEQGKYFREGKFPSDFYDLAFSPGINYYSRDLSDSLNLDLATEFSLSSGNISCAFIKAIDYETFAFSAFESRFENEFGGANTNRPYFQTKYFIFNKDQLIDLYKQGFSVICQLVDFDHLESIFQTYDKIQGEKQYETLFNNPNAVNNLFLANNIHLNAPQISDLARAIEKIYTGYSDEIIIHSIPSLKLQMVFFDAINALMIPLMNELITFSLSPACKAKVMANIRFVPQEGHDSSHADSSNQFVQIITGTINYLIEKSSNWSQICERVFPSKVDLSEFGQPGTLSRLQSWSYLIQEEYEELFRISSENNCRQFIDFLSEKSIRHLLQTGNEEVITRLISNFALTKIEFLQWLELLIHAKVDDQLKQRVFNQRISEPKFEMSSLIQLFIDFPKVSKESFLNKDNEFAVYNLIKIKTSNESSSIFLSEENIQKKFMEKVKRMFPDDACELEFWLTQFVLYFARSNCSISSIFSKFDIEIDDHKDLFCSLYEKLNENGQLLYKDDISKYTSLKAKSEKPEILLNLPSAQELTIFNPNIGQSTDISLDNKSDTVPNILSDARITKRVLPLPKVFSIKESFFTRRWRSLYKRIINALYDDMKSEMETYFKQHPDEKYSKPQNIFKYILCLFVVIVLYLIFCCVMYFLY